jgi:3-hydroxyacyl-[acyl-carrier-protein] dehydratase
MKETWYSIRTPDTKTPGPGYVEAVVNSGSPWYSGHFPGEPILPGIAQIAIVLDIIKNTRNGGGEISLSELKRIRFRQVIRPDTVMKITVLPDEKKPEIFSFKISVGDDLASNGILVTRKSS